jgi:hypothetical protein
MRVEPTKQAACGRTGGTARDAAPVEHHSDSRALVALTPAVMPAPQMSFRQAAFLAHLIAVKDQLPQTRERRRAEPGEAIAAYRAVEALVA